MMLCVVCFLIGICSVQGFSVLPAWPFVFFGSIMLCIVFQYGIVFLTDRLTKNERAHGPRFYNPTTKRCYEVLIVLRVGIQKGGLIAFVAGFAWMWWHSQVQLDKRLPDVLEGKSLTVIGTIVSLPECRQGYVRYTSDAQQNVCRFEFKVEHAQTGDLWKNPGYVRVLWQNPDQILKVGDRWQFAVKLKKPINYANPGSFDNEKHFFRNRWVAQGYVDTKLAAQHLESAWFSCSVDRLRGLILEKMKQPLKERKLGSLIIALVVGVRENIDPAQWGVFRDTGTAHLMAISGLHVGLVASIFYGCFYWGWRCLPVGCLVIPAGWVAACAGLGSAIVYSFLAGFSIPTQRALVMVALFMVSQLARRIRSTLWNYGIALGIVLLIDPFATLTVGFWLSFGAVGVILYGTSGRLQPQGLWWRWARVHWVVFLGLMPMTLAAFNQVSWISPLANMVAIPWVSFGVVPFALFGTLLLFMTKQAGQSLLQFSETLLAGLWPFLEGCAGLPKVIWASAEFSMVSVILATIGVFVVLAPKGFPNRVLGCISILPLLLARAPSVPHGMARFTLLDVGQGLSAVVETARHVLVFDTGPKLSPDFDTGDRVVLPFLATRGWKHIDTLMISHGDNDHIGGLHSLLKKVPVREIITSEIDKIPKQHSPKLCYAGQRWHWDGIEFEVIHPEALDTRKRNDHCCVLRVSSGVQAVLLTADIESKSEYQLLERAHNKLAASILVVPHHGSRTSSSEAFIQAVNPQYALIPVGYRNRYGHPKPDVVKRYHDQGVVLVNTIQKGAMTFVLNHSNKIQEPVFHRLTDRRYWHRVFD